MDETSKKIGFFNKIKIAIFKLEDYGFFLGERFKISLKYFFLFVLLLSVVMTAVDTYNISKMINKGYSYIVNELPDFTYTDGNIIFPENIDAYDHEYHFKLLVNTNEEFSEEELESYKTKVYNNGNGIIALKDKFIYIANGTEAEYSYVDFFNMSAQTIENKEDLVQMFGQTGMASIVTTFFITDLILIYISNIITIFSDLIVIAIFGLIAARFCGMRFKIAPMFSLGIYSLTLPIVLTAVYSVVYGLTGFVINYFDVMYLLIAYVYIIAAILMIKYDLIKQHYEVEKIMEVQKQIHEELKEQEEKEKEEKKEEKPQDKEEKKEEPEEPTVESGEPDGSEI